MNSKDTIMVMLLGMTTSEIELEIKCACLYFIHDIIE